MTKPVAIVAGYMIRYPLGGHVMSQLHFLVGLQQLGYDVVFVEHYGWPDSCYDPRTNTTSDDPASGIAAIVPVLAQYGVTRWCYVADDGTSHDLSRDELRSLCRDAVLFSVSSATWLEEFRECSTRVFVDIDPGFTQFGMPPQPSPSCDGYASPHDFHFHFTIGERIGHPDCPIPTHGLSWRPTRVPIVLDLLPVRFTPEAKFFTTVMSWSSRKPITHNGEVYGQKDVEFMRVIDLPRRVGPIFEIALAGPNAPRAEIAAAGWRLADPLSVTATVDAYRDYIARSRGEFSVAVNLEVKTRSGWFSDRSAAYLATGKPVVAQDTGFSKIIPCGEGLFAFRTMDDAAAAIEQIARDYPQHCAAARWIAEEFFDARKVLGAMLRECDLPVTTSSARRA